MVMSSEFWSGKRVLVTGDTGFKGSWLCLWLNRLGADVVGYALDPPSEPNLFESIGLGTKITHTHGDIRNYECLVSVFESHRPELVFHLAAQALVRKSYGDPLETYSTNVMGTVNVLEAVRHTPSVRVVVNVTSDKCYENKEWVWGYRENDPMGGHDPYSSSKGCAELVTAAYLKSFFPPGSYGGEHHVVVASARAGNVIGGGDWGTDRLVPDCIRSWSHDKEIIIRNPHATRPWQHVLEPLSGYLLLGSRLWDDGPRFAGPWNFGPSEDDVWPVEGVVKEIIHILGSGIYRVVSDGRHHEAHRLKLDCSKARIQLGWHPRSNVQEALIWSAEWYKMFYGNASQSEMLDFTSRQICQFMDRSNNAKE
jgi:CDP-glucose 4,6-dehydratase